LVNRGVWRKTTGEVVELENATLVNEAGGVLELAAGSLYRYSGSATLQNSGLIKKVSSNRRGVAGITITGSGRVQVEEGVLQLESVYFGGRDGAGGAGGDVLARGGSGCGAD
jgi:hypothetical protein